ncbi:hypothetical protein RvY_00523 [Ramazzottius varieornatus]|uniref:Gustatory receptor n=1 Tax=Ramazzottius varieornatus TaxID=947166 RepID=A0A1D1UMZ1_RAMVA|nr:hypothetical protein RvY_00523 [Ramazzottius varieornatus]
MKPPAMTKKVRSDLVFTVNRHKMFEKFLTYLWISGLYYSPTEMASRKKCGLRRAYSYTMALVVAMVAFAGLADYVLSYLESISTLDFFILAELVDNVSICFQIPIIYLIFHCLHDRISKLLEDFPATMGHLLTLNERRITEKRITTMGFVWILGCFLAFSALSVWYHWPLIGSLDGLTDRDHQLVIFKGVPGWAVALFNQTVYSLCVNADGAAQIFYIGLILYLAIGFRKITNHVRAMDHQNSAESLESLKEFAKHLQLLRNLTSNFNDTFGLLITINCIRDLVAVVATTALLLKAS